MRIRAASIVLTVLVTPCHSRADDADLIPEGVLDAPPPPPDAEARPSKYRGKYFLEDTFTASAFDDDVVVPYPSSLAVAWHSLTSLDARLQWTPFESLSFTLSDRLSLDFQDQQAPVSPNTVRNDFREGFVTWEPHTNDYFEAGRINVRNGTALGFNPTDFFKTRTLVGQASLDPSVLRQNRLGTLMFRAQAIWNRFSASIALAPKVASPSPIRESEPMGVDPRFGATNSAYRVLGTLNFDVLNLSPQLLGYFEEGRSKAGFSLSRPIGDAVVAYTEWAFGPEKNLITRAYEFGQETGTLPENAPLLPPTSTGTSFRNDAAAGLSWTIAAQVTFNAEYHFHQAALGSRDWTNWFDLGSAPGVPPALTSELWYLRAYAQDQQEPLSQHQVFVRAWWPRALVNDLELSAFAFVSLLDGSVLSQVSADYYLSNRWTASLYLSSNVGAKRSERGSFPQRASSTFRVTLYL